MVALLCGEFFGLLGCRVVSCLECFVGSFVCLPMTSQRLGSVVGLSGCRVVGLFGELGSLAPLADLLHRAGHLGKPLGARAFHIAHDGR